MKILQVLAGAEHGGAETAFVDMCLALKQAGTDIEVATRPNSLRVPQLINTDIKVHELPFGGFLDVFTAMGLKKIIRDFEPQIVQTWMSRASAKTPRYKKGKLKPYLTVARLGGYYKLKYFKNTDYFVAVTPDIKSYLIKSGIEEKRVTNINNFAETEYVIESVSREEFNTPQDATLLLALGRLHDAKAFDVLLKSIVNLDNVYLWIAGEGPLRSELENLCEELGLKKRVRFLGWRDDRAALFQQADICVFPSRYEPFGTVFVQAWAQNVPLITSNADGPAQFVKDGSDCLLFEIDDVNALSDCIKNLIDNPDLAHNLARAGLQRYEREFTKEKSVESYLAFYKQVLEEKGIYRAD